MVTGGSVTIQLTTGQLGLLGWQLTTELCHRFCRDTSDAGVEEGLGAKKLAKQPCTFIDSDSDPSSSTHRCRHTK